MKKGSYAMSEHLDARSLDRTSYRAVKGYLLKNLRTPRPVVLPTAEKPIAQMDDREYPRHLRATLRALRLRRA
jgi:hypothetical protein